MRIVLTETEPGNFEVGLSPQPGDDPNKIPSQAEIGLTLLKCAHELLAPILTPKRKPKPGIEIATPGQIGKINRS